MARVVGDPIAHLISRFLFVIALTLACAFVPVASLRAEPVVVTPIAAPANVLQLETFKVTGARINASDVGGPAPTDHYDENDLDSSGAFDVGEFLDQLPPSPLGNEQLVLIDGEPTYIDIRTLPPEMIAGIEVANYGGMPQHGAYANGRVINITLKKNYRGASLSVNQRGSFAGGGEQTGVKLSGGATQGKVRLFFDVNYRTQDALYAFERDFSRNQDRTAQGGSDLRLLWGETAVVEAVAGNLNGVFDANGRALAVALVPENQSGAGLQPANFIPGRVIAPFTEPVAAGQRRFNTADTLALVAPSVQRGFNLNLNYALTKAVQFSVTGSLQENRSDRLGPPPVTPISDATLVPAAYNPFGQDVRIGLVHTGFGPVRRHSESTEAQLGFKLSGRFTETWKWNASLGTKLSDAAQRATDLDRENFCAALAAPDPAQRFNPFGDDPRNTALYPQLAVLRTNENKSANSKLDLSANGRAFAAPGGNATLALRGNYSDQVQRRSYQNALGLPDAVINRHPNSHGFTGTLDIPWIDRANPSPALRRFDTEIGSNYSDRSSAGATYNQRLGVLWSPLKSLLLRANYSASWLAPVQSLAEAQPLVTETFIDPRRVPNTAGDVQVITRDFDGTSKGRTEQLVLGATFEPPVLKGLQLSVTYDRQQKRNLTASSFEAQDLIYNESAFPERITRAAPTADDLALNQPGQILSVDTTPIDGGEQSASGLALSMEYRVPSEQFGQIRFSASARHPLTATYEIRPGVPFLFEDDSSFNPPEWTVRSQLSWSKNNWHVSTNLRYSDEVAARSFTTPATTDLDVRIGYKFRQSVWGEWGRGLQVAVGVGNLTQATPPFANTLTGFRGGSALGRTYSLTLKLPLGT